MKIDGAFLTLSLSTFGSGPHGGSSYLTVRAVARCGVGRTILQERQLTGFVSGAAVANGRSVRFLGDYGAMPTMAPHNRDLWLRMEWPIKFPSDATVTGTRASGPMCLGTLD